MELKEIIEKNEEQIKELEKLKSFIGTVREATVLANVIYEAHHKKVYQLECHEECTLEDRCENLYIEFKKYLLKIDGYDFKEIKSKINEIYYIGMVDKCLNKIDESFKRVDSYRRLVDEDDYSKPEMFSKCVRDLQVIIYQYTKVIIQLKSTQIISECLDCSEDN